MTTEAHEGESGTQVAVPDPRYAGPVPDFPKQEQDLPGTEQAMEPEPDHGEKDYQGHGRLQGRVALITGADSGIGRAVALAFAREGADVALGYYTDDEGADQSAHWVEQAGQRALLLKGDLKDRAWCQEMVERTIEELGRLDILVSNAATQTENETLLDLDDDEIERTFETNVYPTFRLVRAAVPVMEPGSSIILVTSIQAYDPSPGLRHYAATKGALANMTKSFAKELLEQGIRVNAVAPGPVWTPLITASFDVEKSAEFGKDNTPMGRPAQPKEIAPTFVFLASEDGRFVVGETIGVTGGELLP